MPELKKWKHASASQIKTFLMCPSKWHWEKIIGLKAPTSPAMFLGKEKHTELENYLATGDESHLSAITLPIVGSGYFELPVPKENIERRVDLATPVVPFVGFIDVEEEDKRRITDHKTLSAMRYRKEEGELRNDPQAIIYSKDALNRWGGDEPITFRHNYYLTRGAPKTCSTSVDLTVEEIESGFERLFPILEEMQNYSLVGAEEVDVNESACSAYGGCPFRQHCGDAGKIDTPVSSLFGKQNKKGKKGMNTLEFMAMLGQQKQQKQAQPEAVEAQPEAVEVQPEAVEVQPEAVEVQPEPVEAISINPPDGTPMDEVVEPKKPKEKRKALKYGGKNVLTLKKPELLEAWKALEPGFKGSLQWDGESKVNKDVLFSDVATMLGGGVEGGGAKVVAEEPVAAKVVAEVVAAEEPVVEEAAEEHVSYNLFIGCHPHGVQVAYVDEILRPLQDSVAENAAAPHYNVLEYGEGPKRVAALLRSELLNDRLQLPRSLCVDRRNPCADAVLDVLVPLYRQAGGLIVERMG